MKLLALDTATEACSCALYVDGMTYHRTTLAPRQHAALILPMADELLNEAGLIPQQLDAVAFGQGPGSFTGLRIACGVAQGIAFAADIPIIPISSLATVAQVSFIEWGTKRVLVALDARMNEIYWGFYHLDLHNIMRLVSEEQVSTAQQVHLPLAGQWEGVGSGWLMYAQILQQQTGITHYVEERYPQAQAMLPLALTAFAAGEIVSAEQASPVYLRNQVIQSFKESA